MSRSEQDGVVSVPSKSSVSSSVCSVVNMVGTSVGGGAVWGAIGLATTGLAVSVLTVRGGLVVVLFLVQDLPGLSGEAGHSVDGDGGAHEAGHVHVLDGDDEISWSSGDCGHSHAETD